MPVSRKMLLILFFSVSFHVHAVKVHYMAECSIAAIAYTILCIFFIVGAFYNLLFVNGLHCMITRSC